MHHWIYLSVAIVSEVAATSALKASDGFSRLWPSVVVIVGYGLAFYFLSLTLRTVPVGIIYAISSRRCGASHSHSLGFYRPSLDTPAILGLALIVAGVVILNVFSKAVPH